MANGPIERYAEYFANIMSVEIKGLKEVQNKIKKLENPQAFFDDVVDDVAVFTYNRLVKTTPYDDLSGLEHTKNMWEFPEKVSDSIYQIDNEKTTKDGKHAIAAILNYGRGEVRPKRAKKLYIPLSRKAKNKDKAPGAKIPSDLKWGKDFVLADKARAYPGTGFINDAEQLGQKIMVKKIIKKVRDTFK